MTAKFFYEGPIVARNDRFLTTQVIKNTENGVISNSNLSNCIFSNCILSLFGYINSISPLPKKTSAMSNSNFTMSSIEEETLISSESLLQNDAMLDSFSDISLHINPEINSIHSSDSTSISLANSQKNFDYDAMPDLREIMTPPPSRKFAEVDIGTLHIDKTAAFRFLTFSFLCLILSLCFYTCICTPLNVYSSGHVSFCSLSSILGDPQIIDDNSNPQKTLNNIKIANANRLIIGQLNINSLRNKIDALRLLIKGNIDILVITESKLDGSFPNSQFDIDGFAPPFRQDRTEYGGGVIIYIRDDIPCKELSHHTPLIDFEGIFLEINLKKSKWLIFGGYNPNKKYIKNFTEKMSRILDSYLPKYENLLLLGDFNSEMIEPTLSDFCDGYDLHNLVKEPTCFKNPLNPSTIDLILTNRPRRFQHSNNIETGLSDYHKLTITVMKSSFQKQIPLIKSFRCYKHFDQFKFRNKLLQELYNVHNGEVGFHTFEQIVIKLLNFYAPIKTKYIRANNSPFMNKTLSKAVMTRSRLRNRFLKNPSLENKAAYTKYRNYCTNLFNREKKSYYNKLDVRNITDNKRFWKTVGPLFSEKHIISKKITLVEGEKIISDDIAIADTFNSYFSTIVENLDIDGFSTFDYSYDPNRDYISNIIVKFEKHPSVVKIKENVKIQHKFHFEPVTEYMILKNIESLDTRKPTTYNNIPSKIIVENKDIFSPFITKMINRSSVTSRFPNSLKLADVTPVYKKEGRALKDNYRPVSILPSISKIFERNMSDQISQYINQHLSPFLFGFRKGYSTQSCLTVMIDKWQKARDNGKVAGALLTDLSKAFDCLNHELLIAKLEAYGFGKSALGYIFSYLNDRKQRTKVNNSYSEWSRIRHGVPQGSILGPLLFNIDINDIFFFVGSDIANYADDNTPYSVENTAECLIRSLEKDTNILIQWFKDNYFKLNADKCHLLISNSKKDVFINVKEEILECERSVKLLGITIDSQLTFNEHVSKLCKKTSQKLHALARIARYIDEDKLRILMKAFIESQFGYCPLIWMFHSRTLNNRINNLHERALRIVYKNKHLSFEELLRKDNSFSIHNRNLQKLAVEMYKVKNDLSPTLLKEVFPIRNISYNLRNRNPFLSRNVRSVNNGTESISFRGPQIWSIVPENIKNASSLSEFKSKIKHWEPKGCKCRLCKIYVQHIGFI